MPLLSHEELVENRTVSLKGNKDVVLFLGTERGYAVLKEIVRQKVARVVAVCVQDSEGHGSDISSQIADDARVAGADIYTSSNLPPEKYSDFLSGYGPATALCINWRRLFPTEALTAAKRGLLVAHDSLLPHLRGFAPLNHAIRNGEDKTGVTLFYADGATDSGDVIGQKETDIGPVEYVSTVRDRVTALTVDLITDYLPRVLEGKADGTPQDHSKATYGVRLTPEDGAINFASSSKKIFNLIRATSEPYPGAFAHLDKQKTSPIRVWTASLPHDAPRVAGSIVGRVVKIVPEKGIFVCTGDGTLLLEEVQVGDKRVSVDKILNRYSATLY